MTDITRRDFLNGVAIGVAAGASLSPLEAVARGLIAPTALGPDYCPPALTGLRGSHPGSFEVAHDVAWLGKRWTPPGDQTDETYDLVVVGGGLSGLAAAWFFREKAGPDAKILILDNHDDFGGHAKQVEFDVDGRKLISYGGSQTITMPSEFPESAKRLMKEVGFAPDPFCEYFDREFYARYMQPGIFFDGTRYRESKLVASPLGRLADAVGVERSHDYEEMIRQFPVSDETQAKLTALFTSKRDSVYSGASPEESIHRMRHQSYEAFVREEHGMTDEGCLVLRDYLKGPGTAFGMDAVPVLEASGFAGMPVPGIESLGPEFSSASLADSYVHHFPGGNSGAARLVVRSLIPKAAPGNTMEDMVLAHFDYGALDDPKSPVRIRLNSTGVDVRHTKDGKAVDVTYVQGGSAFRVRGKHAVMACYNHILPFICPEMGNEQREALRYASKDPFAYTQIALRNWHPIEKGGFGLVYIPGAFVPEFWMDFPVSMGGYEFPKTPGDPMVLSAFPAHTPDGSGLSAREQNKIARHRMLQFSFAGYEKALLEQLGAIWGPYGMDPKRDVAAITVNRWPHGYAYAYNSLFDPDEYSAYADTGPHVTGRARMNRISIGNSDAGAEAMVQSAIKQGHRAAQEQLAVS